MTKVVNRFAIMTGAVIKNVFAENCVAVLFIVAMVLNIILPEDKKEEAK